MKKKYTPLKMDTITVELKRSLLAGSVVTPVNIMINKVEVEDFKSGFMDENGNDFKELTFD